MLTRTTRQEWRVVWKRVGCRRKVKRFGSRTTAEKFLLLFGPEPWLYDLKPGAGPDDLWCCTGRECACQRQTYREKSDEQRSRQPGLEFVKLESRPRLPWAVELSEVAGAAILSDFAGRSDAAC